MTDDQPVAEVFLSDAPGATDRPRVTIGVPTYNRAGLLQRALASLARQELADFEIVVSDNCSQDETRQVLAEFAEVFPRLRTFRHGSTVPAPVNFATVLRMARGEYFMWASDDDDWHPALASILARHLDGAADVVLVAAEAQYMTPDGHRLPHFAEGTAWYGRQFACVADRLSAVVRSNYGNLIYGLYRREALLSGSGTVLDNWRSLNEIPVFLHVASRGEIQVLPDVLFYKTAPMSVYLAAARQMSVRIAPEHLPSVQPSAVPESASRVRVALGRRRHVIGYHWDTARDCVRAIGELPLSLHDRANITTQLVASVTAHGARLMVKPDSR